MTARMAGISRALVLALLLALGACAAPRPPAPGPAAQPERPSFSQTGVASWYGSDHQGMETADGERFDMHAMTAAHRDLPFHTVARVTSVATGRAVKVRINDRGPHVKDRIIDLSSAAAASLGLGENGVMNVRVEVFASDQSP
ncbi:MAG TPA: septal ring lytic transglycosylase RlpA family protein [Stellaceae bacterium]|nr:septal ring lytic transglycosylase RlpA family protein [Stellaceae bacterium]